MFLILYLIHYRFCPHALLVGCHKPSGVSECLYHRVWSTWSNHPNLPILRPLGTVLECMFGIPWSRQRKPFHHGLALECHTFWLGSECQDHKAWSRWSIRPRLQNHHPLDMVLWYRHVTRWHYHYMDCRHEQGLVCYKPSFWSGFRVHKV